MDAVLLQENQFFTDITLTDEEAEEVRRREREWPTFYAKRKLGMVE
jgi:hypothetical protein